MGSKNYVVITLGSYVRIILKKIAFELRPKVTLVSVRKLSNKTMQM